MCKTVLDFFKEMAPVIVSVAALIVAYQSYRISENQLAISTVRVQPHFYVDEVAIYDEKAESWTERELKVFNIGAPVANIRPMINSFYKINDYKDVGEKWIPINGYYFAAFRTGEPKGKISTHKGYKNAAKNFNATFIQFRDNNSEYIDIVLKHIVFISYLSFDGIDKHVCFLDKLRVNCSDVSQHKQIDASNVIELNDLTYKKLIKKYHSLKEI